MTPNARVFANEADSTPSSPKVPTAKKSRKKEVQEKAQNATPAPFNRSATSPAKATDSGAQAGAGSKREEKVEKAPLASLPPPDTATPPPRLPEASREKMRACAIEWSKLKLEARDPMPLWRDFGAQCLKR
ncbi:hypothetical protein DSM21852_21090 [Methylocystis bryophila]|nr:hypothetical protein DSM21852_21090 [Methylocystis bryophila]